MWRLRIRTSTIEDLFFIIVFGLLSILDYILPPAAVRIGQSPVQEAWVLQNSTDRLSQALKLYCISLVCSCFTLQIYVQAVINFSSLLPVLLTQHAPGYTMPSSGGKRQASKIGRRVTTYVRKEPAHSHPHSNTAFDRPGYFPRTHSRSSTLTGSHEKRLPPITLLHWQCYKRVTPDLDLALFPQPKNHSEAFLFASLEQS